MVPHGTTLYQKHLEIQALRCNGETRGRCQHKRHHKYPPVLTSTMVYYHGGTVPWYHGSTHMYIQHYLQNDVPWYCNTKVHVYVQIKHYLKNNLNYKYKWYSSTYTMVWHNTMVPWYVRPYVRTAVYPPKTHVVLSAHVCPFPIRKLFSVRTCVHTYLEVPFGTMVHVYTYHGTQ